MNRARFYIWLPLFLFLSCLHLSAQDSKILQRIITPVFPENTFLGHVDNLLIQEDVVLAFNSSRVDLTEVIKLSKGAQTLEKLIGSLFYNHNIKLIASDKKVIITFIDRPINTKLTIKGYIRDSETGEALVGAIIVEINSNSSTFSNESGFYSISVPLESNTINVHYLGYKSLLKKDVMTSSQNMPLEFDNEIDPVIIEGSVSDNFLLGSGSEKIDLSQTQGFQSTSGDNDLITAVRISPKVQSGNEGQVGLHVRGGGSDQNLILFDGIPLYEVSHLVGFSSMFIEESIKDVDLITNGFPARYGGRLSSVMNVRLKEGNQSGHDGSVKVSLPAVKAHLEGPLFGRPNTTFNISGRITYAQKYLNGLIGDLVVYDNIDLGYYDIVGKITHRFSPTQKLSISYYDGKDSLGLIRSNTTIDSAQNVFHSMSNSRINWGSTVWNAKFTNVITDKLQLAFNVGGIKYTNNSNAQFRTSSVLNDLPSPEEEREFLAHTQIEDQLAGINFDYYLNKRNRLKFGGSWIHHNYNPSLYGNDTIGIIPPITNDENLIIADELALFIEDTYRYKNWQIYGGFHFSGFNIGSQKYRNTQPRFNTVFTPDSKNRFSVSYSRMIQYVHLLVNPGTGIPSDFWVPSTETMVPESAHQISFGYSRKINNSVELSFSGYTKYMDNLLEYKNSVYLFPAPGAFPPSIQNDPDWENATTSGTSKSHGLEFQIRKTAGTVTGWFSYALSKTTRQFDQINDGLEFPYKYDRRHDINAGIKYNLNKNCSISGKWSFGTGGSFSLSLEGFKTIIPGIDVVTNGERNNRRFPSFSHLDFQFNYVKEIKNSKLTFNLGLYNVYNRKNAYYIYIYNNPNNNTNEAYKNSLFPILPNMSLGYSF